MRNSNSWFLWPHVFQFLLICYNKKFFHSCGVTHTFSLSFFQIVPLSLFVFVFVFCFFFFFFFFFFFHSDLPFILLPPPPLYNNILCCYLYNCLVASQILRDIFLYFLSFFPTLILELWLLGVVCAVQVVSYAFNAAEVR